MNWKKLIGGLLVLKGIGLGFLAYKGITGFVVGDFVGFNAWFILSFVLLIGGMILFMAGRKRINFYSANSKSISLRK